MSKRKDRFADEFGVADLNELFESDPQRGFERGHDTDMSRRQAHEELERRIHSGTLRPLHGREEIKSDWMTDDPVWREFNGPPAKGPTIGERQQLAREYGNEIERLLSRPLTQPQPKEAMPKTAEETAELLFREFSAQYGELAKDANRLEAAAKKVIEAGGFDFAKRADFYKRVAAELSS